MKIPKIYTDAILWTGAIGGIYFLVTRVLVNTIYPDAN